MGKIYQVLVKGLKGETTTVDISQTEKEFNETTVLVFKRKLLTKFPQGTVQAEDLRLLFANEQLEDDKRLSDYKVMDKSTIMMVLRLPGGGRRC
ncbi:polyubiquitin-like [Amblyraja radiata]|uniref:polyubiquitin-like n=1 Tax=Amblyraja radiata TaxID=386614 RepID=UPI0014032E64|nr:polyubiquitin-like [Amblyraja radiata]